MIKVIVLIEEAYSGFKLWIIGNKEKEKNVQENFEYFPLLLKCQLGKSHRRIKDVLVSSVGIWCIFDMEIDCGFCVLF